MGLLSKLQTGVKIISQNLTGGKIYQFLTNIAKGVLFFGIAAVYSRTKLVARVQSGVISLTMDIELKEMVIKPDMAELARLWKQIPANVKEQASDLEQQIQVSSELLRQFITLYFSDLDKKEFKKLKLERLRELRDYLDYIDESITKQVEYSDIVFQTGENFGVRPERRMTAVLEYRDLLQNLKTDLHSMISRVYQSKHLRDLKEFDECGYSENILFICNRLRKRIIKWGMPKALAVGVFELVHEDLDISALDADGDTVEILLYCADHAVRTLDINCVDQLYDKFAPEYQLPRHGHKSLALTSTRWPQFRKNMTTILARQPSRHGLPSPSSTNEQLLETYVKVNRDIESGKLDPKPLALPASRSTTESGND